MPPQLPSPHVARSLGRCLSESSTSSSLCRASSFALSLTSSSASTSSSSSHTAPRLRPRISSTAAIHTTSAARAAPAGGLDPRRLLLADYVPPTQPPSAKRPDIRKAQLLRAYTSLLRSTPLLLVFQHSNLTGPEWAALRRELGRALDAAGDAQKQLGVAWPDDLAASIRLQVIRTRMFDVALRVTEFFDPQAVAAESTTKGKVYNHDLSEAAYAAVKQAAAAGATTDANSVYGQLAPLLVGPLAVLTFPAVSPAHLAAALSVLAPSAPQFPAPTRRKNPGYYDPAVQSALQKLLLVGGRVEGRAFDADGVRWVGGIEGGRAGLQAQLVALLQSAGLGLTTALEGASKSLWLTVEGRRTMLEDGGGSSQDAAKDAPKEA